MIEIDERDLDSLLQIAADIIESVPKKGGTWSMVPRTLIEQLQTKLRDDYGLHIDMRDFR